VLGDGRDRRVGVREEDRAGRGEDALVVAGGFGAAAAQGWGAHAESISERIIPFK
jgi:hypothetical protein